MKREKKTNKPTWNGSPRLVHPHWKNLPTSKNKQLDLCPLIVLLTLTRFPSRFFRKNSQSSGMIVSICRRLKHSNYCINSLLLLANGTQMKPLAEPEFRKSSEKYGSTLYLKPSIELNTQQMENVVQNHALRHPRVQK